MNETIVYHGITFHLIPGQKPCFQYDIENAVYTGYIDPDIDMDSLMELLDAIEEDKQHREPQQNINPIDSVTGLPITGYISINGLDSFLPMMEAGTDIEWVESCIRSRKEHPENYSGEDISAVIARQKELLASLIKKAMKPAKPKPPPQGCMIIELARSS